MESQPQNPEFRNNPENLHPCNKWTTNRGSYMSAHVLLNLLNELRKRDKMRGCQAFYLFFATSSQSIQKCKSRNVRFYTTLSIL